LDSLITPHDPLDPVPHLLLALLFSSTSPHPPTPPLFPYTTLFRSDHRARVDHDALAEPHPGADGHARVHDRRLADLGARPDERQRTDPDVGPAEGPPLGYGQRPGP